VYDRSNYRYGEEWRVSRRKKFYCAQRSPGGGSGPGKDSLVVSSLVVSLRNRSMPVPCFPRQRASQCTVVFTVLEYQYCSSKRDTKVYNIRSMTDISFLVFMGRKSVASW
jgi:hypothetical protein